MQFKFTYLNTYFKAKKIVFCSIWYKEKVRSSPQMKMFQSQFTSQYFYTMYGKLFLNRSRMGGSGLKIVLLVVVFHGLGSGPGMAAHLKITVLVLINIAATTQSYQLLSALSLFIYNCLGERYYTYRFTHQASEAQGDYSLLQYKDKKQQTQTLSTGLSRKFQWVNNWKHL